MKYYMVGIKGSGMSSLALFLNELGNEIVGYDDNVNYTFTQKGLDINNIMIYYDSSCDISDVDVFIFSPAFNEEHLEIKRIRATGKNVFSYIQMLGEISKKFKTIAISGCHGKTTTTSMLSYVLNNTTGANYIIGDGSAHANNKNEIFVVEACEYRRHFLNYDPYYTIITNIDLDHIDYYKDIDDMRSAYEQLCAKTRGYVIACGDNLEVRKMNVDKNKILYYGLDVNNDIVLKNVIMNNEGSKFNVIFKGEDLGRFELNLFGKHMLLNAASIIAVCHLEGLTSFEIEKNLKNFKGAKRRFVVEEVQNTILIDDYAHHPKEVEVTILSARQKYPDREIVAILEVHTYSRMKVFGEAFAKALNNADYQYIMPVYNDREKNSEFLDVKSENILQFLNKGYTIDYGEAKKLIKHKNQVLIFMSSKNIQKLEEEFKEVLKST